MYSRNLTLNNSAFALTKSPTNYSSIKDKEKENIPIKSFKDNFAYERFNSLGNTPTSTETASVFKHPDINNEYNDSVTELVPTNSVTVPSSIESSTSESSVRENNKDNASLMDFFKKLANADTLLIVFLVVFLLLSDNTTNDKLTPLALLAILLI